MPANRMIERQQRVFAALEASGMSALLVTNPINVRYLTGFTGEDSVLLVSRALTVLWSDSRFTTQLQDECPDLRVEIRTARLQQADFICQELAKTGFASVGIESSAMNVSLFQRLSAGLPSTTLAPTSGIVETLRQVKDKEELTEIREAIAIAEKGFRFVMSGLCSGMTERQVAHDLEHGMRRFGALRAAFDPIVGVGPRSVLPHGRGTLIPIETAGFTLVDWGAVGPGGYYSDLTRMVRTASIPPKIEELHRVVLRAQEAAIALMGPGRAAVDVDTAARRVIEEAGFGSLFGHGLGHGIGLEIHEGPRLSPIPQEILRPGMVITVEPGIYIPGVGGVRLEDDVLITEDGAEVLSTLPKEPWAVEL